jgi:hypothetical protein
VTAAVVLGVIGGSIGLLLLAEIVWTADEIRHPERYPRHVGRPELRWCADCEAAREIRIDGACLTCGSHSVAGGGPWHHRCEADAARAAR